MELSFFAEMAWKSALISGAALALAYVLRSRAAADRALVLRIGVAMLLLLPLIAMFLPALEIVAFAAPEALPPLPYVPSPELIAELAAAPAMPTPEPTIWDDPTPLVLLAYAGGLAMVGGRLLGGLFLLRRWTRAGRPVDCPEWRDAFERVRWTAGNAEHVHLLVSDNVKSPLSWGWRNPVILIDSDTLGQPDAADGILAHEIAHIARRDWPVLMLSRLAATLFWFNPLVWLLEREVVQQAEEAADCEATARVEPARYAETLLTWAHIDGALPANSIAPSTSALGRRVRAILDRRMRERPSGSAWTAIAMVLCLAIATPVAAVKLVAAAQDDEAPAAGRSALADVPDAPAAPGAPAAPEAPGAPHADGDFDIDVDIPDVPDIPDIPDITPVINETLAVILPEIPRIVAAATAAVDSREMEEALREAREEMRRAGRLNREQIDAAMREARRAMADARTRVRVVHRAEVAEAIRQAQRAAVDSRRAVRVSMAGAAVGMERGAAGMERGARQMEETAERLRSDRAYREREIERARERGETVTHEQLIEAADDMREGAQGMREGAREMRESAQQMRSGRDD